MNPNQTDYGVPSPIRRAELERDAYDVRDPRHPVREVIARFVGTHTIQAKVEVDRQTLEAMPNTHGLIAFLATLTNGNRIISQGRGSVVIGPNNKWMDRAVHSAFNSAVSDAVIRATKVLDTLSGITIDQHQGGGSRGGTDKASEKQIEFLRTLISRYVSAPSERRQLLQGLETITKKEACDMITRLRQ